MNALHHNESAVTAKLTCFRVAGGEESEPTGAIHCDIGSEIRLELDVLKDPNFFVMGMKQGQRLMQKIGCQRLTLESHRASLRRKETGQG